ncbi:MAG: PLP-dependent transferase, partial [Enterobacterales bacterium]|nr:PLP-dependent transferase [Enterobacterales bacterium]
MPASNFVLGAEQGYSRNDSTPSWQALEALIGGLEQAHCVSFASGMAAISAVFSQLSSGAVIALPDDFYQGVESLAVQGEAKGYWRLERIATEDTQAWLAACKYADLIWLESPSNPLLKVSELDVICQAPRKAGCMVAVDNTLATAINQTPLDLGADFVVQSATKFIGGHSDLLSGVVTTQIDDLYQKLLEQRSLDGATPGALESFLAIRGARTMAIRVER